MFWLTISNRHFQNKINKIYIQVKPRKTVKVIMIPNNKQLMIPNRYKALWLLYLL